MKETIDFYTAKKLMKKLNVIIYGSIKNIEEHFTQSFTNIDILTSYFKKAYIIIFENDSTDNTRENLKSWSQSNKINLNVEKHIILENNLNELYPLRATRLAYCRNKILDYIFSNHLDNEYSYAIHCDLDDRFWCIDFESICNSFQYSSENWDAMTCVSRDVNKGKKYYDYWALRVDNTWFNKNIFSCEAGWPAINFETKTPEFIELLNKTPNLLKTRSSFNGLGIYKLSSIKNSRYNATFHCPKCNNKNQGCWEDNDHIGLHKDMLKNKCNIFINTNMNIMSKPPHSLTYSRYIKDYFSLIKNIDKNTLLYVLKNNLVDKNHSWIDIDTENGEPANIISSYKENEIYSFNFNKKKYTLLNNNVKLINGAIENALSCFVSENLKNNFIGFINFNTHDYFIIKLIFETLIKKIDHSCILTFNHFINYCGYIYNSFKAFYEISQEYHLDFEVIGVNGGFQFNSNVQINANELSSDLYNDKIVAIKITKNPHKTNGTIQLKELKPFINVNKNVNNDNANKKDYSIFNWKLYLELNPDLNKNVMNSPEKAWKHWSTKGYLENRFIYFDLKKYSKENCLLSTIDVFEAIEKCGKNFRKYCKTFPFNAEKTQETSKKYKTELFDWEYYIQMNNDLHHLNSYENAWNHYKIHGEKEGRITNHFNWVHYLILNPDLIDDNICDEEAAIQHYLNSGINEKRIYTL